MAEENQDPIGDEAAETNDDAAQEPEVLDGADAEEPQEKKKKKQECPACEAGAPAWMATFADMATLLMAFFVLILSFTEMEDPSITKMLEGTMTEAFGVQRNKPSLEAPLGQTIIAQQYKTTKAPAGIEAKEDTTSEEPEEQELEERPDVSQSETLTDIENLERTFATEIAAGKVSLEQKDGKITVSVNEDADSNNRDETGSQNNDGRLDREELEIFAKVAESQAFMETELEVEYVTSDSEDEMLRQIRKTQELDDKYQILRAELNAEIQQGLANVEKVGEQILISLSAANSFAPVTLNFSPRLRIRYETSAIPLLARAAMCRYQDTPTISQLPSANVLIQTGICPLPERQRWQISFLPTMQLTVSGSVFLATQTPSLWPITVTPPGGRRTVGSKFS